MAKSKARINKLIIIALTILGLFLIFVISYGALQIYKGRGIDFKAQSPELSRPEIDPETGWKIYRNNELGFALKYPADYFIKDEGQYVLIKNNQNNAQYAVGPINDPVGLTPAEYVANLQKKRNEPEATIVVSFKNILVNGVTGIDTELTGPGSFRARSVLFPVKNQIVKIEYLHDNLALDFNGDHDAYNAYLENGNTIISSFKITDEKLLN